MIHINKRPSVETIKAISEKYFGKVNEVEHVLEGHSTYVYRIKADNVVTYMRLLPEKASFQSEVSAHMLLHDKGLKVPRVLAYEEKNQVTGLSLMLVNEIKGSSLESSYSSAWSSQGFASILYNAGVELSKIHQVKVNGFGWIDKTSQKQLIGEHKTFKDYYCQHLNHDLSKLSLYPFTPIEIDKIKHYIALGKDRLETPNAVLVHGDFDMSHIYQDKGHYSGLIDFGEIRGNNKYYDLATFIAFSQDALAFKHLLSGYDSKSRLEPIDLFSIELMALSILLRFLGKKEKHPSKMHWYQLAIKQLARLDAVQYDYLNCI